MQIMDILNQMGGLQSVARELGMSEQQVNAGAAALLPPYSAVSRSRRRPSRPASRDWPACWAAWVVVACWTRC